jgi:hypothetical protein
MEHIIRFFLFLIGLLPVFFLIWFFRKAFAKKPAGKQAIETERIKYDKNKKQKKEGYGCFMWIALIAGLALFATGSYRVVEYINFKINGESATGVISSVEKTSRRERDSRSGERRTRSNHKAYVTFTIEEKEYTVRSKNVGSNMRWGDEVIVLYMPDNPEKALVDKYTFLGIIVLLVFGGILLLVALYEVRFRKLIESGEVTVTDHSA